MITVIIAVYKKCDLLAGAGYVAKIGIKARLRQHIGPGNDEILFRVGLAAGPFDFSAFMGGRNGNIETGVVRLHCPRRAEALFRVRVFLPRARHEGGHDFRAVGPGVDGFQHIRPRSACAGGEKTESEKERKDQAHEWATDDEDRFINNRRLKKLLLKNELHSSGCLRCGRTLPTLLSVPLRFRPYT